MNSGAYIFTPSIGLLVEGPGDFSGSQEDERVGCLRVNDLQSMNEFQPFTYLRGLVNHWPFPGLGAPSEEWELWYLSQKNIHSGGALVPSAVRRPMLET